MDTGGFSRASAPALEGGPPSLHSLSPQGRERAMNVCAETPSFNRCPSLPPPRPTPRRDVSARAMNVYSEDPEFTAERGVAIEALAPVLEQARPSQLYLHSFIMYIVILL